MKKIRASKVSIMILTLLVLSACASSRPIDHPSIVHHPYLSKDFMGQQSDRPVANIAGEDPLKSRPIESWVGERFVFLPTKKELQFMGYKLRDDQGVSSRLRYEKYVGRIARVASLRKEGIYWDIDLIMEDNLEKVKAKIFDYLDGMAPVEDIKIARSRWLGKTLWSREGFFYTFHESLDKSKVIRFKRYSPVKVTAIIGSDLCTYPVRFFLKTNSGEEGFMDLSPTGTNVPDYYGAKYKGRFQDLFLAEDPRIKYPWSDEIWTAIEESRLLIGMTKEQVMMSWGTPKAIHSTTTSQIGYSQWVYEGLGLRRIYLYFDGGKLTATQD